MGGISVKAPWRKKPAPKPVLLLEGPAEPVIEVIARPLIVGAPLDAVNHAHFRIAQIFNHIEHHADQIPEKWWDEVEVEAYSLLHTLGRYNAIDREYKDRFLTTINRRSI